MKKNIRPQEFYNVVIKDVLRGIKKKKGIGKKRKRLRGVWERELGKASNGDHCVVVAVGDERQPCRKKRKIAENRKEEDFSSDLDSDDDVEEEVFPPTDNIVISFAHVKKKAGVWILNLNNGVIILNNRDFVFKQAKVTLNW